MRRCLPFHPPFLFRAPRKIPHLSDRCWGLMPSSPGLRGTGFIQGGTDLDFPSVLHFSSLVSFPTEGDRGGPTEELAYHFCTEGACPLLAARGRRVVKPEGLVRGAERLPTSPSAHPVAGRWGVGGGNHKLERAFDWSLLGQRHWEEGMSHWPRRQCCSPTPLPGPAARFCPLPGKKKESTCAIFEQKKGKKKKRKSTSPRSLTQQQQQNVSRSAKTCVWTLPRGSQWTGPLISFSAKNSGFMWWRI